jgi:hypothetical protein
MRKSHLKYGRSYVYKLFEKYSGSKRAITALMIYKSSNGNKQAKISRISI